MVQKKTFLILMGFSSCVLDKRETTLVGTHNWIGYETLFLANEFKWLDGIKLKENTSATDTLKQLKNREIAIGSLTLDEILLARSCGVPLTIVLAVNLEIAKDIKKVIKGHFKALDYIYKYRLEKKSKLFKVAIYQEKSFNI